MLEGRTLSRSELARIWEIDRSEVIEALYSLVDGALVLRAQHFDVTGWQPGKAEEETPIMIDCFDRGGWFHGIFDGQRMVGVAVLDGRFLGSDGKQLQLAFLHVSARYRDKGLGKQLFLLAAAEARRRSASSLYISATPSQHTVDFYLRRGCAIAREPDPQLFELEPEDIHLEYDLGVIRTR
jgi:predicted N-acetyltransferase YhbS